MRGTTRGFVALLCLPVLVGCEGLGRDTRLVVRTTLPEELREHVEERFEADNPTVDVRYSEADNESSLGELAAATDAPPFDVWWGAPALTLARAAEAGELEPIRPAWADTDSASSWHSILVTPFVIAFNREALELSRAPLDWIDLFHFRWTEEVWALDPTRTPEGAYFTGAMVVEALRDDDDLNRGFDWLARLDGQVERYAASTEEILAGLDTRDALLGIVPEAGVDAAKADGATWLYYRIPESGTPVLARGVAVARGTPVSAAARSFVDFIGSQEALTATAAYTHWEPAFGIDGAGVSDDDADVALGWTPFPFAIDTLLTELHGWIDRWELETASR